MKEVSWIDKDGYIRKSLLRDKDPEHLAPSGVPLDPPDIDRLNWEDLKRQLHNALSDKGLRTWQDVMSQGNGITNAIVSVFKKPIVELYRQDDREAKKIIRGG